MNDGDGVRRLHADVAVVGAGPGGATLAYLLARSGVDVRLLERERDLARTFRGYLFQPSALRMLDEMGLLEAALALDHHPVRAPSLSVYGRTVTPFDFGRYEAPYDRAVLMEQPPLLRLLVDGAGEYDSFEYRDGTTVDGLLEEDGLVAGVRATDRAADEDVEVRTRLVVGADGRYSTVRTAAGIDPGLLGSTVELVWFKLPAEAVTADALGVVDDAGVLLYFGLGGGEAQLGYFVEKGEYARLRTAGIEALHERVVAVDPSLDGVVQRHVAGYDDCSLLHVEPGVSDRWTDDGLCLLGDAAHVASPVGGQGNGLAIADAVVAHPVVLDALAGTRGPVPREALRRYERRRRPTVERILRLQRRGERALSAFVRHRHRVPAFARAPLVRGLAALAFRTSLAGRLRDRFAWGSYEPVDASRFVDARPAQSGGGNG